MIVRILRQPQERRRHLVHILTTIDRTAQHATSTRSHCINTIFHRPNRHQSQQHYHRCLFTNLFNRSLVTLINLPPLAPTSASPQQRLFEQYRQYSNGSIDTTKPVVSSSGMNTADEDSTSATAAAAVTPPPPPPPSSPPMESRSNNDQTQKQPQPQQQNQTKKPKRKRRSKWAWTKKLKKNHKGDDDKDDKNDGDGSESDNHNPKPPKFKRDFRAILSTPHRGSYAHPQMSHLSKSTPPSPSPTPSSTPTPTVKRKTALLIGYIGSQYTGFQMNEHQTTIQAELELALHRAGCISDSNFGYPQKIGWSTAARTDKGVHSCASVCSAKLELPKPDEEGEGEEGGGGGGGERVVMEDVRNRINRYLPSDIRILDMMKVTKSFCAKTARDKVRYVYTFPSFVLMDREELRNAMGDDLPPPTTPTPTTSEDPPTQPPPSTTTTPTPPPTDLSSPTKIQSLRQNASLPTYRATPTTLTRLTQTLQLYIGTHSFHNYTSGKSPNDPSAIRFIHSIRLGTTTTTTGGKQKGGGGREGNTVTAVDRHGVEWITVEIVGQSFLLHQIRKMMSMAMDVAADCGGGGGKVSLEMMRRSLIGGKGGKGGNHHTDGDGGDNGGGEKEPKKNGKEEEEECNTTPIKINVNVAPAQGLFLDMSYYGSYNRKNPSHDCIRWHDDDDDDGVVDEKDEEEGGKGNDDGESGGGTKRWRDFKDNTVIGHIMDEEEREGNFVKYLLQREYYNR